jgi:hypothetical protein
VAAHSANLTGGASARHSRRYYALALAMLLSLALNLWGNAWGTPDRWHPDEIEDEAAGLVKHKTLNPHFFAYGGLHYYVLAAAAVLPVGAYSAVFDRKPPEDSGTAIAEWRDRKNARLKIMARAVSALMGTLLVFFTYLMGEMLFGTATGLLAALFLAVCPYFVEIAHFSTVDMAANFWFWLASLFSLLIWKRGAGKWYALAAFTAGLATGVKADRLLVVLPILLAHFLGGDRKRLASRKIMACALLLPVGYIVANPTLLFSFFEFLDGTTRELYFNILRGSGEKSYWQMVADTRVGMGGPLSAVSLAGLIYLFVEFFRGRKRAETAWLLSIIGPYYLIFGSRLSLPWYSPFFYPALAMIAAYGCVALVRALPARVPAAAVMAAIFTVAAFSLLRSIAGDLQFVHDARYLAVRWAESNIPSGLVVEVGRRAPPLTATRFHLVKRSNTPSDFYEEFRNWSHDLENFRPYQRVRQNLLGLEGFVREKFHLKPRAPYQAWFDKSLSYKSLGDNSNNENATPDYCLFVDYLDYALVRQYQAPNSGYALAARLHYDDFLGLGAPFPFVNPTVYIFRRDPEATKSKPESATTEQVNFPISTTTR